MAITITCPKCNAINSITEQNHTCGVKCGKCKERFYLHGMGELGLHLKTAHCTVSLEDLAAKVIVNENYLYKKVERLQWAIALVLLLVFILMGVFIYTG